MGKEQTYKDQLSELGVYNPAFDGEIRQLCILERELSRTMKAWKATGKDSDTPPSVLDPLYASIQAQRRDILAHRDALGLTPKDLKRLRGMQPTVNSEDNPDRVANAEFARVLDAIVQKADG